MFIMNEHMDTNETSILTVELSFTNKSCQNMT